MRTWITMFCAALLALAAMSVAAQPPAAQPAKPSALAVVPTDSFAFFTVNASKLWENPGFKPLRDWLAAQKVGPTDEIFGLPPTEIDRITVFMPPLTRDPLPVVLVTTRKPYNEAKVLKALGADQGNRGDRTRVGSAVKINSRAFPTLVFVDDRTLMFLESSRENELALPALLGQIIAKKADGPLAAALADAVKHDFAMAFDARPFAAIFDVADNREIAPYQALLKAHTLTFTANFDKTAHLSLKLAFPSTEAAKRAAPVLKEAGADLAALFSKELDRRKDRIDPLQQFVLGSAITVIKAAKVEQDGANVLTTAELPYQDTVAKFAAALPKSYSAAISSVKGQNNLKQLALAMHNFESANGVFPGDVIPFGNMPLAWSWRVQILPYIEQDNLYRQLDMTKAWDDPANLKKLEAMPMPKIFEIPGRSAPKGYTYFRVFKMPKNAKGTDRPWLVEGERGPKITTILDGTSNTLMIVEAGEAVPWYKPDVLAYDGKLPLPQLGDKTADRFLAAMGDGSVRMLKPSKLGEKTLRALITTSGGEAINLP